ncbi:MAG: hypothetical protein QXI90_01040 [Thermofilum sp.]
MHVERRCLCFTAACIALALLASIAAAQPCPEPEDLYAVEAVLSAPGARLDFRALKDAREVAPGVYAYRSGFDTRVVVLLYYSAAPPLGVSFPTVRFQVPFAGKVPLFNLTGEELCRAAGFELERLSKEQVLGGAGGDMLKAFRAACAAGKAGWDYRLLWFNGTWVSYYQVPGAAPQAVCRAPLPLDVYEIPVWPAQEHPLRAVALALLLAAVLALALFSWKKIRATAARS